MAAVMVDDVEDEGVANEGRVQQQYGRFAGGGGGGGYGRRGRMGSNGRPVLSNQVQFRDVNVDDDVQSAAYQKRVAEEKKAEHLKRVLYAKGRTPSHWPTMGAIHVPYELQHRFTPEEKLSGKQKVTFQWMVFYAPLDAFKTSAQTWSDMHGHKRIGKVHDTLLKALVFLMHRVKSYSGEKLRGSGPGYKYRPLQQHMFAERILSTRVDENESHRKEHTRAAAAAASALRREESNVGSEGTESKYVDENKAVYARVEALEKEHKVLHRKPEDDDGKLFSRAKRVTELGSLRREFEAVAHAPAEQDVCGLRIHFVVEELEEDCKELEEEDNDVVDKHTPPDVEDWKKECPEEYERANNTVFVPGAAAGSEEDDDEDDEEEDPKKAFKRRKAKNQQQDALDTAFLKYKQRKKDEAKFALGQRGTSRLDRAWFDLKRCLSENERYKGDKEARQASPHLKLSPGEMQCIDSIQRLKNLFDAMKIYHADSTNVEHTKPNRTLCSVFHELNRLSPLDVFDPETQIGRGSDHASVTQSDFARYCINRRSVKHAPENQFYIKFPRPECVWTLPDHIDTFWHTLMPFVSTDMLMPGLHQGFNAMIKGKAPQYRYSEYVKLLIARYKHMATWKQKKMYFEAALDLYSFVLNYGRSGVLWETDSSAIDTDKLKQLLPRKAVGRGRKRKRRNDDDGGGRGDDEDDEDEDDMLPRARARVDLDKVGCPEGSEQKCDFMSTNGTRGLTAAQRAERTARYQLYSELWCNSELEGRSFAIPPPKPLTFFLVQEENDKDTKDVNRRLEEMKRTLGGDAKNPEYVQYQKREMEWLSQRRFGRLSKIVREKEGNASAGARAHIDFISDVVTGEKKNFNEFRCSRVYRDTSAFQEMMISLITLPKISHGSFKNHDLWVNIALSVFPSYFRKDLAANLLLAGPNSQGKSFSMNAVADVMIENTAKVVTTMSMMSQLTNESDISDELIMIEEAPMSVFIAMQRNDASAKEMQLWKNKLTKYKQRWEVFHRGTDGTRQTLRGDVYGGNSYVIAMNPPPPHIPMDEAMISRFQRVGVETSAMDAQRHPTTEAHAIGAEEKEVIDQNIKRYRFLQALAWMTIKAIVTRALPSVSMEHAMIMVYKVLDEAAGRGATDTRHPRNVSRLSMTIEALCVLRAVYSLYFIQTDATDEAFPDDEEFLETHLERISPLLVPMKEEIAFSLLLRASQFQDHSSALIGAAIERMFFANTTKDEALLRWEITDPDDLAALRLWFSDAKVQAEYRKDPVAFERTYGVGVGTNVRADRKTQPFPDMKHLPFLAIDHERYRLHTTADAFERQLIGQLGASVNVKAAVQSLGSATSVLSRKAVPKTFKYWKHLTEGVNKEPRKITFVPDQKDPRLGMVYIAASLLDEKAGQRPVLDAVNAVFGLRDREGPMMLLPEACPSGDAQWRYFRTPKNPAARPLKFPSMERISLPVRNVQKRIFTKRMTKRDKQRADQQNAADVTHSRSVFDRAFQPTASLDMSTQELEYDEFVLEERRKTIGLTDISDKRYDYLRNTTPAQILKNMPTELGRDFETTERYEDMKYLNWSTVPAQSPHGGAVPAQMPPQPGGSGNLDSKHGHEAKAGRAPPVQKSKPKGKRAAAAAAAAAASATVAAGVITGPPAQRQRGQFDRSAQAPASAAAAAAAMPVTTTTATLYAVSLAGAVSAAAGDVQLAAQHASRRAQRRAQVAGSSDASRGTSTAVYDSQESVPEMFHPLPASSTAAAVASSSSSSLSLSQTLFLSQPQSQSVV